MTDMIFMRCPHCENLPTREQLYSMSVRFNIIADEQVLLCPSCNKEYTVVRSIYYDLIIYGDN